MNRIVPICALLASTLAFACAAQTEEPSTAESTEALVNAPLDTKNPWAVGVCSSPPNTDPAKGNLGACVTAGSRCTGSLIAPNLVLTARHCVHALDYSNATSFCEGGVYGAPLNDGKVRVTLDPSVLAANPTWINVAEVITEGALDNSCQNDIAILRLATAVPAASAKPIALDTRALVAHHPHKVAVVGRGILTSLTDLTTGAGLDDGPGANGNLNRRFLTDIPFVCVSNNPNHPCVIDDYTSPPTNKFSLPTTAYFAIGVGIASGDSGSAILASAKFKAGHPVAVGVTSAGTADKNGVGNFGLGVRLDTHEAWLKATLKGQAKGAYTLVDSTSTTNAGDE